MQHRNATVDQRGQAGNKQFAWRRMKPWQIWALAAAAVAFIVIGLAVT
jgi:hypothetical protein